MITILRFETTDRVGMYGSCNADFLRDFSKHIVPQSDLVLWEALIDEADSDDEDDIKSVMQEYIFGFASIKQIYRWIYRPEWFQMLENRGVIISEYECKEEDCIIGFSQAMFKSHVSRTPHKISNYFFTE